MNLQTRLAKPLRYLWVACAFVALTYLAYAALTHQAGNVTEVVVEIQPTPDGLFLIQGLDVEKRLDAGPQGALIGQTVENIAYEPLERFLEQDPFIDKADLYTGFDGKLHVTIEQKRPLLRIHHRTGADYYLGPQGEVLPLSKHDVARVPVLTGEVPSFVEAASDTLAIEAFVLAQRLAEDKLLSALIEQIELRNGSYILVPKLGSAVVTLGTLENLDEKLDRYITFLRGAVPQVGWEAYTNIDLSFAGQVVCRKHRPGA